jgi:hypothetical protein
MSRSVRRECTPLCKVCKDSGKPEQLFTSHFTKNRDGKVICPTLLALACKKCNKKGHTASYCTVKTVEEKPKQIVVEEKPIILCPRVKVYRGNCIQMDAIQQVTSVTFVEKKVPEVTEDSSVPKKKKRVIYVDNWADVEDSDDECEYQWCTKKILEKRRNA